MTEMIAELATGAESIGGPETTLTHDEINGFIREQLGAADLDGKSVCLVIPDGTRSSPLPLLLKAVHAALHGRVSRLTAVVALGTHLAMSEQALATHLGYGEGGLEGTYPGMTVLNHEWWEPETFVTLGTISAERVNELSGGLLSVPAKVALNRAVVDHDVALVVGPVFPHEVVGFSGGNKYFFPGIAGQEIIDLTHWVGALITSVEIIGTLVIYRLMAMLMMIVPTLLERPLSARASSIDGDEAVVISEEVGCGFVDRRTRPAFGLPDLTARGGGQDEECEEQPHSEEAGVVHACMVAGQAHRASGGVCGMVRQDRTLRGGPELVSRTVSRAAQWASAAMAP